MDIGWMNFAQTGSGYPAIRQFREVINAEEPDQVQSTTEYEDHVYCHQLEAAPQADTGGDADLARRLQREQDEGPEGPRTMRLPANLEQMMAMLPPQFHHIVMQIRGSPEGQARVIVQSTGEQREGPQIIHPPRGFLREGMPMDLGTLMQMMGQNSHYNHGQGMDSSAIEEMPVTTFKAVPGTEKTQCVVCITDLQSGDEIRTLPCFHKFHKTCIDEWLTREGKCPICKRPVTGN